MKLKYDLRSWQEKALTEWSRAGRRGIVEVVTGGGKTIFAEACILEVLRHEPQTRVLVVVPTVALLDQWLVSLQEELGASPGEIGAYGGGYPKGEPRLINVAVVNSARTLSSSLSSKGAWMLVADECHRLGAARNSEALRGSFLATLGLSATPERQYDDALEETIAPALGDVVYRYDLVAARKDGVVSPFSLINVEIQLLDDEEREYNRLSRRIGALSRRPEDETPDRLEALLRARARVYNRATMRIPVTAKLIHSNRSKRIMVFHEDIASAERILGLVKEREHSAISYHTRISPVLRASNLRLFRRGVYDVMISCRALDEGINIPETQVGIIASSTATTRQRIQRMGRLLRPAKRKEEAIVYTLFATEVERVRLQEECRQLSDVTSVSWMRANVNV